MIDEIKKGEELEVSVARLDERQKALASIVTEIKNNHLVHIANDIKELRAGQNTASDNLEKVRMQLARWGGGIAAVLVILQLIIAFHTFFR